MEDKQNDISEYELERVIEERARHKELISAIQGLTTILRANQTDSNTPEELSGIIERNNNLVELLISRLKVPFDINKVISAINSVKLEIPEKDDPKEWEFTIERDLFERIQSVTAKSK